MSTIVNMVKTLLAIIISIFLFLTLSQDDNSKKNTLAIVTILHPGTCDTKLSKPFQSLVPKDKLFSPSQSSEYLINIISEQKPYDSGKFLAWDRSIIPW